MLLAFGIVDKARTRLQLMWLLHGGSCVLEAAWTERDAAATADLNE